MNTWGNCLWSTWLLSLVSVCFTIKAAQFTFSGLIMMEPKLGKCKFWLVYHVNILICVFKEWTNLNHDFILVSSCIYTACCPPCYPSRFGVWLTASPVSNPLILSQIGLKEPRPVSLTLPLWFIPLMFHCYSPKLIICVINFFDFLTISCVSPANTLRKDHLYTLNSTQIRELFTLVTL